MTENPKTTHQRFSNQWYQTPVPPTWTLCRVPSRSIMLLFGSWGILL